jgi:hypothetical protein
LYKLNTAKVTPPAPTHPMRVGHPVLLTDEECLKYGRAPGGRDYVYKQQVRNLTEKVVEEFAKRGIVAIPEIHK